MPSAQRAGGGSSLDGSISTTACRSSSCSSVPSPIASFSGFPEDTITLSPFFSRRCAARSPDALRMKVTLVRPPPPRDERGGDALAFSEVSAQPKRSSFCGAERCTRRRIAASSVRNS
eukprot:5923347-Prymnesium_polylepis.1